MTMFDQIWPFIVKSTPVLVDGLPWRHVFGGNHNIGQVLRSGGTLYIDDSKPTPAEFERSLRNLREVSSTMYLNVPKGFELLLPALAQDNELRKRFFADLDAMFYAAATLPEHLWHGLAELAQRERPHDPPSMISGWGLTETAPGSLILNRHDAGSETSFTSAKQRGQLVPNGGKLEIGYAAPTSRQLLARARVDQTGVRRRRYFITGDAVTFVDEG